MIMPASPEALLADRSYYLPFGKQLNGQPAKNNSIGYTGHVEDSSGLVNMQARSYDPVIGRFYSNDPVGYTSSNPVMSFNRYLYVNNNPYKYRDPNGEFLDPLTVFGGVVGAVVNVGISVMSGNTSPEQLLNNVSNAQQEIGNVVDQSAMKAACSALVAKC